ncbi:sulfotransferase family protein [Parvularcula oceani]|uniref:sulfotransferase family protein n=1 Tax=Parvularcula oceani TaxID=1247963 RepID=UPI00138DDBAB|nr:sulfotransferase family protein [Parvularcula oceani]
MTGPAGGQGGKGLEVIGAGFGRTGTASLKIALERLLGAPCYHMSEVLGRAGHMDLWLDAAEGRPDWDAIFADYAATVDFPAASYWRDLAAAYPEAKVVLTTRDPETWFRSTQATIFSPVLHDRLAGTKWERMLRATIEEHLGGDYGDREALLATFARHEAAVREAVPPDRLLVFKVAEGWGPLCRFLGQAEPDEPFPRVNAREDFDTLAELLASPIGPRVMNGEGLPEPGSVHEKVFEDAGTRGP